MIKMELEKFQFLDPDNLEEAVQYREEHGKDSYFVAGGTDLLKLIKDGEISPLYLINLKNLDDLCGIKGENGGLVIGAATPLSQITKSQLIREKYDILCQGAGKVGSPQIRNIATIGGNLCNASPAMDTGPSLVCLDARLRILGPTGEREIPVSDFLIGPGETDLENDELLKEVFIPQPPKKCKGIYLKHSRRKDFDLAIVGVGVVLSISDGIYDQVRIGMGAVAPTPIRAEEAESYLEGKEVNRENVDHAASLAERTCQPITDVRSSDSFRENLTHTLVKKALTKLSDLGDSSAQEGD